MSELAIDIQNQELEHFDFDCEYQQQLEQEQAVFIHQFGLQKFNELFAQEFNQKENTKCH